MSEPKSPSGSRSPGSGPLGEHEPGWAKGLRKLYNSVLEEPLPDSFDDLLKQLDEAPARHTDNPTSAPTSNKGGADAP